MQVSEANLKIEWQICCSFLFSQRKATELLKKIAKALGATGDMGLTVHLVLKKEMILLNRKYRKINQVTDVLSFPLGSFKLPKKIPHLLGDIVICIPKLKEQAKKNSNSLKNEFELLLVHGFLHLLGFDHEKNRESWEKTLKKLYQKQILS